MVEILRGYRSKEVARRPIEEHRWPEATLNPIVWEAPENFGAKVPGGSRVLFARRGRCPLSSSALR
jgi:hypothetical protein